MTLSGLRWKCLLVASDGLVLLRRARRACVGVLEEIRQLALDAEALQYAERMHAEAEE